MTLQPADGTRGDAGIRMPAAGGFDAYWGKARPPIAAQEHPCHLLPLHSLDVAAVAVTALRRWPGIRRLMARQLPLTDAQLEGWIGFWVALHDLGKFAESFQSQCPDLFVTMRGRAPDPARPYTLHHDSLGLLFWNEVLRERVVEQAWFGPTTDELAYGLDAWVRATTGHHGEPPRAGDAWVQHFQARDDGPAAATFVDAVRLNRTGFRGGLLA